MANAYLTFSTSQGQQRFNINVMEFYQTHALTGSEHQAHNHKHFYARSYAPGHVEVQGRTRTQDGYNRLAAYIRRHHRLMINQHGRHNVGTNRNKHLSLMTLGIPTENFYVAGWITSFEAGEKRFNPAPPFTFNFQVVQDKHSVRLNNARISRLVQSYFWQGVNALEIQPQAESAVGSGVISDGRLSPEFDTIRGGD